MKINRDNVKWAARLFSILLVVVVADGLVGGFMRRPLPWVVIIPALLPLLISVFVILPMIREKMTTRRGG
jgi:hypothetical protein